jgi:hypothetical protein
MDKKEVKSIADKEAAKEVHKHEKHMHKGVKETKLAKGGVTGKAMKAMGRNMARAMNQRSAGRGR